MSKHRILANSRVEGPEAFMETFNVSRETVEKLLLYESLLKTWQKAVNLVAPSTMAQIWLRHFADSAQILERIPDGKCWVDLGSGGGFPGLVIAILLANHKNRIVHLVESNGRKCAFMSEVIRQTGASAKVHSGRIEALTHGDVFGQIDVVTSRALAPLDGLFELSYPLFGEQTLGIFLKGREVEQEITDAEQNWTFEHRCAPSLTSEDGAILELRNLKRRQ